MMYFPKLNDYQAGILHIRNVSQYYRAPMGGFTLHSDPASKQMWQVEEKYITMLPYLCVFTGARNNIESEEASIEWREAWQAVQADWDLDWAQTGAEVNGWSMA